MLDFENSIKDFHDNKINKERLIHIVRDASVSMLFDDIRDSLDDLNEVNIPLVQRVISSFRRQLYNF